MSFSFVRASNHLQILLEIIMSKLWRNFWLFNAALAALGLILSSVRLRRGK